MKKLLLRTMLLLCALIAGSGTMWGDELKLDFESATSAYSDWTFVTIKPQCTNSNVKAHGGSYYGGTDGKTSGSVTTTNKIANPTSIVFYVSKESTNTTASSWLVKVSTDGSNWTKVGADQSASSGITRGTWTEVSRDLSTYSDVYVRIEYSGTTAKRCIDDVTLTYTTGGVLTPCVTDLDLTTKSFALDSDGTLTATATEDAGLTGSVTYTFASADDDVLTVLSDGTYEAVAIGTTKVTVTATPTGGNASGYEAVEAEVDVKVTGTTTMTLSASEDIETFGTPISFSVTGLADGYDGTVTVSSGNTAVATASISSGTVTVTPVAVGTAVITVTAPATDLYLGSVERTFTAEFAQPAGGTTAKAGGDDVDLFHESFGNNTGSARDWDDSYSVKTGVSSVYKDIAEYTVSNARQGKNTTGSTQSGLNQSTSGTDAYIIIGPLNVTAYSDLKLTYQWKAASTKGTYTTSAYYKTSAGGDFTEVSGTGVGATTFVERSYSLPAAAQVSTLYLKIVWNTSNTQAIIDEVKLTGDAAPSESVTLNASGYATFCTQYSLDFTDYATNGFSAWQITDVSDETITFSEIKSTIKGGQGILLKGTAGATITIPSSDSSTSLDDNKLVGTLAPTYAATDTYYGLSGNKFVKVNAGTVKAGKALLPASAIPASARELTFVFEGDETTGVKTIDNGQWTIDNGAIYDLQGRKVTKPVKGGLYIVNGKKVIK